MRSRLPEALFFISLVLLLGTVLILTGHAPHVLQTALLPETKPAEEASAKAPPVEAARAPAQDAFGVPLSLSTQENEVRRGETFADILTQYVPYATMARVVDEARPVFDARHLRPGKTYRAYLQGDSLHYFIYQRDPVNYVVFDLTDSIRVYEDKRTVDVVKKEVETVIEGSLYESLQEVDAPVRLIQKLANVYAWQIDFFRIQKGDFVKAIYEERQVDGVPIGVGKVLAVRFNHVGYDYYGFYFEQDGRSDYFDERAQNLRKALLKAPLEYGQVTSRYTKRRYHPILKEYRSHLGTDYAAPKGTPIHSVGDGIVTEAEYGRYNGNYVKVRHNGTYTTQYLHMSKIKEDLESGDRVYQGDVIGYVGETGLATGPHVCYRFWKNGRQVDPAKQDIPSAPPVDSTHMDRFEQVKNKLMPRLEMERSEKLALATPR